MHSNLLLGISVLPLVGSCLLLLVPRGNSKLLNLIALNFSILPFIGSLLVWAYFKKSTCQFQFVTKASWLSTLNFNLTLGIDGISLFFLLLTTLLIPICILLSWNGVKKDLKEYLLAFLLLEFFLILVFGIFDSLPFIFFFERILIPMFLIIGFGVLEKENYWLIFFWRPCSIELLKAKIIKDLGKIKKILCGIVANHYIFILICIIHISIVNFTSLCTLVPVYVLRAQLLKFLNKVGFNYIISTIFTNLDIILNVLSLSFMVFPDSSPFEGGPGGQDNPPGGGGDDNSRKPFNSPGSPKVNVELTTVFKDGQWCNLPSSWVNNMAPTLVNIEPDPWFRQQPADQQARILAFWERYVSNWYDTADNIPKYEFDGKTSK